MEKNPPAKAGQRIAKLLARAGVASRREIERMIAESRVALHGEVIKTPATILASLRGVTVDGQPVREPAPARLFRYHKPPGCLTAERDPKGRPTIYDRLPKDLPRLVPVGRLDLNTEGLLLLTTDGELKRQLELPSTGVIRSYRARAFGAVSQEQLEELIHGIEIDGIRYGSIDANLERRTGRNQWIEMTLTEGKNREVRRVLEHLGLQVSRLIRTAYGPFVLGDLAPGAVDEVRQHDLVEFRRGLGKDFAARRQQRLRERPAEQPTAQRPQRAIAGPARARPSRAAPHPRPAAPPQDQRKPARPQRPLREATGRPARRPKAADDKEALHHRPPRGTKPERKPASPPADGASEKPARMKRGAGWAKPKPRPSSRPTRRGAAAKRHPSKGRPGGSKR